MKKGKILVLVVLLVSMISLGVGATMDYTGNRWDVYSEAPGGVGALTQYNSEFYLFEENTNPYLYRYDSSFNFLENITVEQTNQYQYGMEYIEEDNRFYVTEYGDNEILEYDTNFNHLATHSAPNPMGIAKVNGHYFVGDYIDDNITEFDSNFNKVDSYSVGHAPRGVIYGDGYFYTVDYGGTVYKIDPDTFNTVNTWDISAETGDSQANDLGDITETGSNIYISSEDSSSTTYIWEFDGFNHPPEFNSSSVSPDPPLVGENVSYSAEVHDPDGSIDYTNLTLEYGGSTVVQDEKRTGTAPSWNDIYKPDSSDKWLNATLETVDDQGAVTTTEINRYLDDTAPHIELRDPDNKTYWKYDVPVEWKIVEDDSMPNEENSCDIKKDGSVVDSVNVTDGNTYSGTISTSNGTHTATVECSDPAGNTNSSSETYSVQYHKVTDLYGDSVTYETEDPLFDATVKTGSMIQDIKYYLHWDGEVVDIGSELDASGIMKVAETLERTDVPLVSNNATSKNWYFTYEMNRSEFSGSGYVLENHSTSTNSQEVRWSYYLRDNYTDPENGNYIEREDLKHLSEIHTRTKEADLTGTTTYWRNGETDSVELQENTSDYETYQGVIDTGKISEPTNTSQFKTSTEVQVSFNGDTRSITTPNSSIDVYRMKLTQCGTNLDTSESLVFDTDYEESLQDISTDLVMDSTIWKTGEIERTYNFKSQGKKEHKFCIYPSWAEYTIDTGEQLIQYYGDSSNDNLVRRSYFLLEETINNDTTTVPLRAINDSESTRIRYEIDDPNGNDYPGVVCRIDRYFPGEGEHQTVAMIKTGSQGKSETFLEVNEIYYRHTCYDASTGEFLDQYDDQIVSDPMKFQIGEKERADLFDYDNGVYFTCSQNNTGISCDYEAQTEDLNQINLTLEKVNTLDYTTVCQKTGETATGSLTCRGNVTHNGKTHSINATANNYKWDLTATFGEDNVWKNVESGSLGDPDQKYPGVGLMVAMLLFLAGFFAGAFHPVAAITLGTGTFVASWYLSLIPIPRNVVMSVVAVGMVAGWVITN